MTIQKVQNNKAWFMVLPVLILVAISAIIPLMTVVNYSVQDTFGTMNFSGSARNGFKRYCHRSDFIMHY